MFGKGSGIKPEESVGSRDAEEVIILRCCLLSVGVSVVRIGVYVEVF